MVGGQDDALDFFKAWAVVHRCLPSLPQDPLLASRYLTLLATGARQAASEPDRQAAMVDLLWTAAQNPSQPMVCLTRSSMRFVSGGMRLSALWLFHLVTTGYPCWLVEA
jgi:hypothetical protein